MAMMVPQTVAPAPARRPRFWSGTLKVARVFDETHDVRTLRLVEPSGNALPFANLPGQYLNLTLTIGGNRVRRSYTIASSSTRGAYCEVTIKRKEMGFVSHHVHDALRVGSLIEVSAPAGRFVFTGSETKAVVLLAGGVGITPLMSMVRHLTDTSWGGDIYFVVSARREKDIIFREELTYLARRFPNLHLRVTLSNEDSPSWTGARGRVNEALLTAMIPDFTGLPFYLCGPEPMMKATRALLRSLKVPETSILTEAFVSPSNGAAPAERSASEAATPEPALQTMSLQVFALKLGKRGASLKMTADQTVLEAADLAGQDLPFECRSGVCGQCKVKLLRGKVTMQAQDALTTADKADGIILACQARPTEDLELDA
jgi:ferredoxin-NADP reductase